MFPDDIQALVDEVHARLRERKLCLATAESCTGGLLSGALTERAGSSDVFERGFVTYSNEAKLDQLKVSLDVLETFGAVSIAVAWAMARGAILNSRADIAISITGVAGPAGGTDRKPVGTVMFAIARRGTGDEPEQVISTERRFADRGGDMARDAIRTQAVRVALELLLENV